MELRHLTANGGDDPALDELLFDFSVATAARRDGACALIVGRIYRTKQMIGMIEKYGHEVEMPVSVKMIERLLAHAIERGGPQCDPTSDIYRPDAPVFWRREGRLGFKPVTGRRFDTLHHRWQTSSLPFANEDRATYHIIRHTMGAIIGSTYGESYKARYLRHTVTNVTGGYGKCTDEELAAAMAHLLRFEHPLVQGRDERRAAAMKRFGLEG